MGEIFKGILFFWLCFFQIQTLKADDLKDHPLQIKKYTTTELQAMSYESLLQVSQSSYEILRQVETQMSRSPGIPFSASPLTQLANFPFEEHQRILFAFYRKELKRPATSSPQEEVIFEPHILLTILDIIQQMGTATTDTLRELEELIEETVSDLKQIPEKQNSAPFIIHRMKTILLLFKQQPHKLVSLESLLSTKEAQDPKSKINRAENILKSRIKGQPEIVEGFTHAIRMDYLYKKDLLSPPGAFYLMGLPATGKDTSLEAFIDALHGREGAYFDHMFRLPILSKEADLWPVLGSNQGYIGSDKFPEFLAFLVLHSDGKYKLSPVDKGQFRILLNPDYKGKTLPGYFHPSQGLVFCNEVHKWSKRVKDLLLNSALDKGVFRINNPNGGLTSIQVPIRFGLASNEGIGLIAVRDFRGRRVGLPLTYPQLLQRWEANHTNQNLLKSTILSESNSRDQNQPEPPGISEEILSRIPNDNIFLLRPLSPEVLQEITELRLQDIACRLSQSELLGDVTLTWDKNIVQFIQGYDFMAEEGGRNISPMIRQLIEKPILEAHKAGTIRQLRKLHVSIRKNENQSHNLVMDAVDENGTSFQVVQIIPLTLKDIPTPEISDERIKELRQLATTLKQNVFGIDPIVDRLAGSLLQIENHQQDLKQPVNTLMLTGLSSTGKTELAKQIHKLYGGTNEDIPTFDFSKIQTMSELEREIIGYRDLYGETQPSRFMQEYERRNGKLIVAFDEMANVKDPEILKLLYNFFREPYMVNFPDSRPRPMGSVTVIITGNAGKELFENVPKSLPMEVQMEAWAEIYRRTNADYALQQAILSRYYPTPLLARIGQNNIYFVPPHNYKSLRQVAQLKIQMALESLAHTSGGRRWKVMFSSTDEYTQFVDSVIEEGFQLASQAASIDSYVRDEFHKPMENLLLTELVPTDSPVVLKLREKTDNTQSETEGQIIYDVYVNGRMKPLEFRMRRKFVQPQLARNPENLILTAYHEAGHSLVRQALFPGAVTPELISIRQGVALIGEQWIYYAGINRDSFTEDLLITRERIVREIAVLLGGETAERLVSLGELENAGKANDTERATRLARDSILKYGLSKKWGIHAIPQNMSELDYLNQLSDKDRKLLENEVRLLVEEGRNLAQLVVSTHLQSVLAPLAVQLAEHGTLGSKELKKFYQTHIIQMPNSPPSVAKKTSNNRSKNDGKQAHGILSRGHLMQAKIDPSLPRPLKIFDEKLEAEKIKRELYAQVERTDQLPVGRNEAFDRAHTQYKVIQTKINDLNSCAWLLRPVGSSIP